MDDEADQHLEAYQRPHAALDRLLQLDPSDLAILSEVEILRSFLHRQELQEGLIRTALGVDNTSSSSRARSYRGRESFFSKLPPEVLRRIIKELAALHIISAKKSKNAKGDYDDWYGCQPTTRIRCPYTFRRLLKYSQISKAWDGELRAVLVSSLEIQASANISRVLQEVTDETAIKAISVSKHVVGNMDWAQNHHHIAAVLSFYTPSQLHLANSNLPTFMLWSTECQQRSRRQGTRSYCRRPFELMLRSTLSAFLNRFVHVLSHLEIGFQLSAAELVILLINSKKLIHVVLEGAPISQATARKAAYKIREPIALRSFHSRSVVPLVLLEAILSHGWITELSVPVIPDSMWNSVPIISNKTQSQYSRSSYASDSSYPSAFAENGHRITKMSIWAIDVGPPNEDGDYSYVSSILAFTPNVEELWIMGCRHAYLDFTTLPKLRKLIVPMTPILLPSPNATPPIALNPKPSIYKLLKQGKLASLQSLTLDQALYADRNHESVKEQRYRQKQDLHLACEELGVNLTFQTKQRFFPDARGLVDFIDAPVYAINDPNADDWHNDANGEWGDEW